MRPVVCPRNADLAGEGTAGDDEHSGALPTASPLSSGPTRIARRMAIRPWRFPAIAASRQ
jgi:hypothetical protein